MAVVRCSLSVAAAIGVPGWLRGVSGGYGARPTGRRPRMLECSYAGLKCADDMEFV